MSRGIERARRDLKRIHRDLLAHIRRHEAGLDRKGRSGLSPGEFHDHLADLGEEIAHRLRISALRGPGNQRLRRSGAQEMAFKWMSITWRVDGGLLGLPGSRPPVRREGGPDARLRRHTVWVGSLMDLLDTLPAAAASSIGSPHPKFGDLSIPEWIRYLLTYVRAKDLEFFS